jgi:hypothetical protein
MTTGACSPHRVEVEWPEGTVLSLNGTAIGNDWVEEIANLFVHVEPGASEAQRKRLALTNIIFPLLASRSLDRDRRTMNEGLAAGYLEELRGGQTDFEGPVVGPQPHTVTGGLHDLGLIAWGRCWDMEPGDWSPVCESIGTFEIFQLLDKDIGALPGQTRFTVRMVEFPWLDPEAPRVEVETVLDASRLTIVDPAWRVIVPGFWRHRLGADRP